MHATSTCWKYAGGCGGVLQCACMVADLPNRSMHILQMMDMHLHAYHVPLAWIQTLDEA